MYVESRDGTGQPIMKFKVRILLFFLLLWFVLFPHSYGHSAEEKNSSAPLNPQKLALVKATMCEGLKERVPYNEGVVFPLGAGRVYCYSEFDPVPKKTAIYHNWYYRGKPSTRVKLNLQPPRWSTYSTINLEEADKGPWRVEITDQEGVVLGVVRFSITD
jgi:hypothetical protein